jgi:dTDP-4-dehydrorhamnose 3,5-epimerase
VIFTATPLAGAFVIDVQRHDDPRGYFARSWCVQEAAAHGIDVTWVQFNISFNRKRGTLRGMHFQYPNWEDKLVRVTRGAIVDVIADLRPASPTYKRTFSVTLSADDHNMLLVPKGFAHGFMSLQDDTEIFYHMSELYVAEQARGFRFDDPQFAIAWPAGEKILSDRDRDLPLYAP